MTDRVAAFEIVRHPRARRARLAFDPTSGRARLVLPKRAALKPALAWANGQQAWIAAQRARLPVARPFVPGVVLPIDDHDVTIDWRPGTARTVTREGDTVFGSGPVETFGRRIEAWLRREALRVLSDDTAHYAARAGVAVSRVAVGDPRGRWGSCAAGGTIRYSWRLILAPRFVRRATAAHEVAHRVHMNHGPAFHALVRSLYDEDPAPARAWLRAEGAALHWFGRSSG